MTCTYLRAAALVWCTVAVRAEAGRDAADPRRAAGPGPRRGDGAARLRADWTAASPERAPRLVALGYYALEPNGPVAPVPDRLLRFDQIATGAVTDPATVRRTVGEFAKACCDELGLRACSSDSDQVNLLADVTAP